MTTRRLVKFLAQAIATSIVAATCPAAQQGARSTPSVTQLGPTRSAVVFSSDGRLIAAGGSKVTLYDAVSKKAVHTFPSNGPFVEVLHVSEDGDLLLAGDNFGYVRVWDVESKAPLPTFKGLPINVKALDSTRNGLVAAAAGDKPSIKIWEAKSGANVREFRYQDGLVLGANAVRFSPDGTLLASTWNNSSSIMVWDVQSGRTIRVYRDTNGGLGYAGLTWLEDSRRLVAATQMERFQVIDIVEGKLIREINSNHRSSINFSVASSKDGRVLVSSGYDATIRFWNTEDWENFATVDAGGPVQCVALSPNGKQFAYASGGRAYLAAMPKRPADVVGQPDNGDLALAHPLRNVKVGDWAKYRYTQKAGALNGEWDVTKAVSNRQGNRITIRSVTRFPDGKVTEDETTIDLKSAWTVAHQLGFKDAAGLRIRETRSTKQPLQIARRNFDSVCTEYVVSSAGVRGEHRRLIWTAPDAPLGLLLKDEGVADWGARTTAVLIDFGSRGD